MNHGRTRGTRPAGRRILLVTALGAICTGLAPGLAMAQGVTSRSPNLSGGWVAPTGSARFHVTHRFRAVDSAGETRVLASPTFLLGIPVTDRILLGAHIATSSFIANAKGNELELFARWGLPEVAGPVGLAVTGAYNRAAESVDGELSLRVPFTFGEAGLLDGITLLGAARGFSDALGTGEAGWFVGGGLVLHRGNLNLAGDFGSLRSDGVEEEAVWGIGLQMQIPTTPHTLSIHLANARTATLQGSSVGTGTDPGLTGPRSTFWGFEFTVPLTYSRLFG